MNNTDLNNTNTIAYKNIVRNFNIIIGISFIVIISLIYIISLFNINIPNLNYNTDLSSLENIVKENFVFYIKILFSFLIPLSFFIFIFLFVLNPISIKSILISFALIFLTAFYLYNLDYNILTYPFDDLNSFIKLIIHIVSANFIMLFISGMAYIRYNIKKMHTLYDFYTMIAEMIIWSFLIFFIISLIMLSIFAFFYFNGKIEIKRLIRFFINDDMKKLKISISIFIILKTSVIYFSYVIYNKMVNTKLSVSVSRVLTLFLSILSVFMIIYYFINDKHSAFLLLGYFMFSVIFLLNIFLFRIDKENNKVYFIIYIISNIIGCLFSIFCFKECIGRFSNIFLNILNIIMIVNFIYNIAFIIMKRCTKFIFFYNYFYIIFLIMLLLY